MGAYWQERWLKKPGEAAFTRVAQEDFDAELASRDHWHDLGTKSASREASGEAVFLSMYDGAAGEICGTFLYERAVKGELKRALVFAPGPQELLVWCRVEGTPEPWEAPLIASRLDQCIEEWLELRAEEGEEPDEEEVAEKRERWRRFVAGEPQPFLDNDELCAVIKRSVLGAR